MKIVKFEYAAILAAAGFAACAPTSGTLQPSPILSTETIAPGTECPGGGVRVYSGVDLNADGKITAEEARSSASFCNDPARGRLVRVVAVGPGTPCARGGQRLDVGQDDGDGGGVAHDGELSDGEVDSSTFLCNGEDGLEGKDGKDGKDGRDGAVSLVALFDEPPGLHCSSGGTMIATGLDDGGQSDVARDGVLGPSEIGSVAFVCKPDPVYAALAEVVAAPSCAAGGHLLKTGRDDGRGGGIAGDGILQDGEIESASTICNGENGEAGADGVSTLVRVGDAGASCAAGGKKIDVGRDTSADGSLQDGEVESTSYVCNGVAGATGAAGANGWTSLVVVKDAGAACAAGGKVIETGLDDGAPSGIAGDGVLQAGEIDHSDTVCNGATGATGASGANGHASLVAVSDAGAACAAGGKIIQTGLDDGAPSGTADDGVLQPGEVESTTTLCDGADGANGERGFSTLVAVSDAGTACPNGGKKVESGLDDGAPSGTAGDGVLQPGEVETTGYLCDGTNGADGANGTNGKNGVASLVAVSDAGTACANGGKKIETGLDDGAPTGTAGNGTLEPGEVDSTSYVCNGVDGTAGAAGGSGHDSLIVVSDAGTSCASGGKKIETGLDDGAPSGTADDGVLQPGEVESTSYVCNGADGAGGGGGSAKSVYDGDGRLIGDVVSMTSASVVVRTSKGYFLDLSWTGEFLRAQIYYSLASCAGGSRWRNSGGAGKITLTNWVTWEEPTNGLLVPVDNDTPGDGLAVSAAVTASSIWNVTACYSSTGSSGAWPMTTISYADAGVPTSIASPLSIQ